MVTTTSNTQVRVGDTQLRAAETSSSRSSPWMVGLAVLVFYSVWVGVFLGSGHDVRRLIAADDQLIFHNHVPANLAGTVIRYYPHFPYERHGYNYDGQWFYLMALDPVHARYFVQGASYRYTKILYPMAARTAALGKTDLIPYTMVLINLVSIVLGTMILAAWLARRRISSWYALMYALYFGLFISFEHDLTEPMSYALIFAAIFLIDYGRTWRYLTAGLCFALAILTRDKSIIFALPYCVSVLLSNSNPPSGPALGERIRRNMPGALTLFTATILPVAAYRVFLQLWMGNFYLPLNEAAAPVQGLLAGSISKSVFAIESITVFVPAAICGGLALWALWKRVWRVEIFLLLINIELGVLTLHPAYFEDYRGVTRVGIAIVISAILSIPWLDQVTGKRRVWLSTCGAGWVLLTVIWAIESLSTANMT